MTHKTKAITYDTRVRVFWTLAAFSIIFVAIYIYSLHLTIRNTAVRQSLSIQMSELSTRQGSLEFAYIGLRNQVSMETAKGYGFREVASPAYISRTGSNSLTYNR